MDRKAYSGARFGSLIAVKFSFLIFFIFRYNLYKFENESEENLFLLVYILVMFIAIEKTISYTKKNYGKVYLNISQKKVKIIYYFWHIALVGLLILLMFI